MSDLARMVGKDLRRWSRDPIGLLLWAAVPLAVALLMKLAFGMGGGPPQVRLVIADQDRTLVSQLLRGAFSQGPLADLYAVSEADSAEARRLVSAGKVSAFLLIPEGFTDDYLDGRTARLELVTNPAERILPRIAVQTLEVLADGGTVLRGALGDPIAKVRGAVEEESAPRDSTVLAISGSIRSTMDRIADSLFPPVLALTEAKEGRDAADELQPDFLALFFPGVLLMAMLFTGQALSADIWEEHKLGTFRRKAVSPDGAGGLVLAKVIAGTIFYWVIFEVLLLLGRYALRIELGSIHLAAAYLAIAGFGFLAALHLLVVLPRTENGGNVLSSLVVMPLVLVGGSFFPLEAMPPAIRRIGAATPNGAVGEQVKDILFGRAEAGAIGLSLGICLALGAVFVALASRRAGRRFLGE